MAAATKTKLVTHRQQSAKSGSVRNAGGDGNGDRDDKDNRNVGSGDSGDDNEDNNNNGQRRWLEGDGRHQRHHCVRNASGGRRRQKWE